MRAALLITFAITAPALFAAEGELRQKIAEAIRQLSADDFATREKATKDLWAFGRAAEPLLEVVEKGSDPEAAARARRVLRQFKLGISPNTSQESIEAIKAYRAGDRNRKRFFAKQILDSNDADKWIILKNLAESELVKDLNTVFADLQTQYPKTYFEHLKAGDLRTAGLFLDACVAARDWRATAARLDNAIVNGTVDAELAGIQSLPLDIRSHRLMAQLHRATGAATAARVAAEKSGDRELQKMILAEQRDWPRLLALLKTPVPNRRNEDENTGELRLKAYYEFRSGDKEAFAKTIDQLKTRKDGATAAAAIYLACDDIPRALEILKENKSQLFLISRQQCKYDDALAHLKGIAPAKPANDEDEFGADSSRLDFFQEIGDFEKIVKILSDNPPNRGDPLYTKGELWEAQMRAGKIAEAQKLREETLTTLTGENENPYVVANFFQGGRFLAPFWWACLAKQAPPVPAKERIALIERLQNGEAPAAELEKLLAPALEITRASVGRNDDLSQYAVNAIPATLRAAKDEALQRRWLENFAPETPRLTCWIALAELAEWKGDWPAAAKVWQKAGEKHPEDFWPPFYEGHALLKAGDEAQGRKKQRLAEMMCGANHYELALGFDADGNTEAAARHFKLAQQTAMLWRANFVSRVRNYDGDEAGYPDNHELARAAAEIGDYAGAEAQCEADLAGELAYAGPAHVMKLSYYVHMFRAQKLLDRGNKEEALREARICLELLPASLELPLALVPMLEKAGMKKEADEIFYSVFNVCDAQLKKWPNAQVLHNNIAWLSANCRRELDRALQHAEKNLAFDKFAVNSLDMLAEVYLARGEKEKAIELERQCVQREPDRREYRLRLKKMLAQRR